MINRFRLFNLLIKLEAEGVNFAAGATAEAFLLLSLQ